MLPPHVILSQSVISLTGMVAVSTKWIWYEIFAGDSCLGSLSRIKYKINYHDTFFVRPGPGTPVTFSRSIHCLRKLKRCISPPGELPLVVSVWWPWLRHRRRRYKITRRSSWLWCPLRRNTCLTALYFRIYQMITSASSHRRSLNAVSKLKKEIKIRPPANFEARPRRGVWYYAHNVQLCIFY